MQGTIQVPLPGLQASMPKTAASEFEARFGRPPTIVAWAPGRVNLIGEHTDYNDGFVLPTAISDGTWVLAAESSRESRIVSLQEGEAAPFSARTVAPGQTEGWVRYVAGVAWALGGASEINALVGTDLPLGSGLSSSAALEVAFAKVWDYLDGKGLTPIETALACQRAEHGMVGVLCGVMDQMASSMGEAGCALSIDVRSLEVEAVPLPPMLSIAVCDTGMPRTLAGSVYNARRRECEQACEALGVQSLRDAEAHMTKLATLEQILGKRASHVVMENRRCRDMALALRSQDRERIGRLMAESHGSLRNNYQVTTVELDEMASAASGAAGCWGARMTGAGMGGACVALVETGFVEQFVEETMRSYRERTKRQTGSVRIVQASGGAAVGPWIGPLEDGANASKNTGKHSRE